MNYHKAHWGLPLIVISSVVAVSFIVILVAFIRYESFIIWVVGWPALVLGVLPFFSIFGYTVTADSILIHRPFRRTRLPLEGLASVEAVPNAMRRACRTYGNGGAFSFTGYFQSNALGEFRAFATDLERTVVLRYEHKRAFSTTGYVGAGDGTMLMVLSPANPEAFVRDVQEALTALPKS